MNSSTRTLKITIDRKKLEELIAPGIEGVLRTLKDIKPREELVSVNIAADIEAPWYAWTDVPLELKIEYLKEVDKIEVDGNKKGL